MKYRFAETLPPASPAARMRTGNEFPASLTRRGGVRPSSHYRARQITSGRLTELER
jgi:hypothetical protein